MDGWITEVEFEQIDEFGFWDQLGEGGELYEGGCLGVGGYPVRHLKAWC